LPIGSAAGLQLKVERKVERDKAKRTVFIFR
jgi:hypothetical protein